MPVRRLDHVSREEWSDGISSHSGMREVPFVSLPRFRGRLNEREGSQECFMVQASKRAKRPRLRTNFAGQPANLPVSER